MKPTIAIDADVLVHYLSGVDPRKKQLADSLFADHLIFISTSVLFETVLILQLEEEFYHINPAKVVPRLFDQPRAIFQNPLQVRTAVNYVKKGLDFANALHLAAAQATDGFATFDNDLSVKGDNAKLSILTMEA